VSHDGFRIVPLRAEHDEERDAFVDAHPRGTTFHTARWRRAVGRVFDHPPRELGAFADDRLVGVLPLMQAPAPFGRRNHVSVPYATYGGPLGESTAIERALTIEAIARAPPRRPRRPGSAPARRC
jgi:hypothetical protein